MSSKDTSKPKLPYYRDLDGFRIPGYFSDDAFRSALSYKPREDDLFIVTFPKCGTTWVQGIVSCIFRQGRPFSSALDFLTQAPFLEKAGAEAVRNMIRPGAIKMHLPFNMTPWSPEAKYIFVARNPKDCCVSFYHHTVSMKGYDFENGQFDDFFELFVEGRTGWGDYFDTILSWYEHRNDPNVLFTTYEQLKKDNRKYVLEIAEFIGPQYKEALEKDEKMLNEVIEHSSFDYMKQTLNKQIIELKSMPKELGLLKYPDMPQGLKESLWSGHEKTSRKDNSKTFDLTRKGVVGDWRNHFLTEQNQRLEAKFYERTKGTDLAELWKDDMFRESIT